MAPKHQNEYFLIAEIPNQLDDLIFNTGLRCAHIWSCITKKFFSHSVLIFEKVPS